MSLFKCGGALLLLSILAFASPPQVQSSPGCYYNDMQIGGPCFNDQSGRCLATCVHHISVHPAGFIRHYCLCENNTPG